MQKAALVLSLAALVLGGWLAWNASTAGTEVERLRHDLDALAVLEARVAALEGVPAANAAPRPAAGLGAPPPGGPGGGAPAGAPPEAAAGSAPRPASVPGRVADLEKRLAALEEKAKEEPPASFRPARMAMTGPNGGRFYASVDDAKDDLALTDLQKGDFERIIADARREAEDLRKIPDDEGKTWEQVQRETFTATEGAFRFDLTKMEAFRKKTVPGRSETYGQAEQRIRDSARRRLRDTLSTAQQEKFDKAVVDPILGVGGAASVVSFGVVTDAVRADDGK
jgi:hypothetical protein